MRHGLLKGNRGGFLRARNPHHTPTAVSDQKDRTEAPSHSNNVSTTTTAPNHVQIQERLRALEAENFRFQTEKRHDRERVLELEQQISQLKEHQDRRLKQEIREVRKTLNHAINQTFMPQISREAEE